MYIPANIHQYSLIAIMVNIQLLRYKYRLFYTLNGNTLPATSFSGQELNQKPLAKCHCLASLLTTFFTYYGHDPRDWVPFQYVMHMASLFDVSSVFLCLVENIFSENLIRFQFIKII